MNTRTIKNRWRISNFQRFFCFKSYIIFAFLYSFEIKNEKRKREKEEKWKTHFFLQDLKNTKIFISPFDDFGKDIVCAAVSSMAITTINNIIALEDSIYYEENSGLLKIRVLKDTEINNKLLDNLVRMLTELKEQYPKNIEIRNED